MAVVTATAAPAASAALRRIKRCCINASKAMIVPALAL
jgi:hypothetical protein